VLEHLLAMSDGTDWREHDYPHEDPRNTVGQMWVSSDAVQYVLDQKRPESRARHGPTTCGQAM
jgi:hypothetical protein